MARSLYETNMTFKRNEHPDTRRALTAGKD